MSEDFGFMDDIIGSLEAATSRGTKKIQTVYLGDHTMKCRIFMDSNKKFQNQAWMYKHTTTELKKDEKTGEMKDWKTTHKYVPPAERENDPVRLLSEELADLNQKTGFKYKNGYTITFFGYMTSITVGGGEYCKPNLPTLFVCTNGRFLDAFKTLLVSMPKEEAAKLLDPKKKFLPLNVTATKGKSGTCSVNIDTYGEPVTIPAEHVDAFEDIYEHYIPKLGPENDAVGLKIAQFYKDLLSGVTAMVIDPSEDNPDYVATDTTAEVSAEDALDASLAGAKNPTKDPDPTDTLDAELNEALKESETVPADPTEDDLPF